MADRPKDPSDSIPTSPKFTGGWRKPSERGVWHPPEKPQDQVEGWRVPAMPANKTVEPESEGAWHLPRPEDTLFSADDVIEITPERVEVIQSRPEDMLFELEANGQEAESAQAGTDEGYSSAALATDDAVSDDVGEAQTVSDDSGSLLHLETVQNGESDEADELDESEPFSMSELMALSSLVESRPGPDIVPTATTGEGEDAVTGASPAERALLQATGAIPAVTEEETEEPAESSDPAAYARRQLERLGTGAQPPVSATGVSAPVPDGTDDPAAYARRQLEELGISSVGNVAAYPTPSASLTPEQQEMARRFRETEEKVRQLRQQYQNGQISQQDLQAQLRQLMILDNNTWWMMGVETDRWYKFENGDWVVAVPPYTTGMMPAVEPQRGVPPTITSGLNPSEVIQGSIPYFASEPVGPETEVTDWTGGFGTPIPTGGTEEMPLPQQVPVQDPDLTQVGAAGAYLDPIRRSDAETIPGMGRVSEVTQVNPAVAGAYEISPGEEVIPGLQTAPEYDVEGLSPTYEEIAERQRARTISTGVRLLLVGIGAILLFGACGLGYVLITYNNIASQYQAQIAGLANFQPPFQTARVLDMDGNLIAEINSPQGGSRTDVALNNISPFLQHAVVSTQNPTFFTDVGWSWGQITQSILQNVSGTTASAENPTITEQIAAQLILRQPATTPDLQLNQAVIAAEIAKLYSKEEILKLYLNEIYFGNQTYGAEAASQFYYGHSADDLNLPEAAMLAAMLTDPTRYNPVRTGEDTTESYNIRREATFDRMDAVIQTMQRVGCLPIPGAPPGGFCVDANAVRQAAAQKATVEASTYAPREVRYRYPHFVQLVQAQVERWFPSQMFTRGFIIRTTLNPTVQDAAESALDRQMASLVTSGINTGSVMVTDPRTGAIRAMVGSPDYNNADIEGSVNGALTWQQPGATIMPFIYMGALEGLDRDGNGTLDYLTPASILWDVPTSFQNPPYTPVNDDNQFWGPLAIRHALQNARNIAATKALSFIGIPKFQDVASRMGLNFMQDAQLGLPTATGTTEVTLYDMMVGYGTIANNGVRTQLYSIESITDANGATIVLPDRAPATQVIQQPVNFLMQSILSDDNARAQRFGLNGPLTISSLPNSNGVGAIAGTTTQNRDLWTMGFTRNAVVGVWLGRPDDRPTVAQNGGYTNAATLWNQVMVAALSEAGRPESFAAPANGSVIQTQICTDTGTAPPPNCTALRTEFFVASQPAPGADQAFVQQINIDTWTGLRANNFCPSNIVTETFVNIPDPSAVAWLNTPAGAATAQRLGLNNSTIENPPAASCDTNTDVPVIGIISPTDNQTVSGVVAVTGAASATTFNRYQLEYALASSPNNFTIIGGPVTTPQTSGTLGQWDTTNIPNGNYILRLAMFANNGGNAFRSVRVVVSNTPPTPTPTVPPPVVVPTSPPIIVPTIPFTETTPLPFDQVPLPP
jgi:membrane peptidoglycan carboxypeptidase